MTKAEVDNLFDSLSFGHDADTRFGDERIFIEWSNDFLEIYHIVDRKGVLLKEISGIDKTNTVSKLFGTTIFGKTLYDNYNEIDILDIE